MNKMRKGDEVIVIAGKDKGKRGTILSVINGGEKVIVEGINIAKKHVKPNPQVGEKGGIQDKPMPIHHSNVMVFDASSEKGSRVGVRVLEDGSRVRYFKSSDQLVNVSE